LRVGVAAFSPEPPFIAGSMSHCSTIELATGAEVFDSLERVHNRRHTD